MENVCSIIHVNAVQNSLHLMVGPTRAVLLGGTFRVLWSEWKEWGWLSILSSSTRWLQKPPNETSKYAMCENPEEKDFSETSLARCWKLKQPVWPYYKPDSSIIIANNTLTANGIRKFLHCVVDSLELAETSIFRDLEVTLIFVTLKRVHYNIEFYNQSQISSFSQVFRCLHMVSPNMVWPFWRHLDEIQWKTLQKGRLLQRLWFGIHGNNIEYQIKCLCFKN